jgi:Tol biopolymer transport system component
MLLIDWCGSPVTHGVVLLSLATGAKRCLTAPKNADDVAEALSPDGKTVAFIRMTSGEVREVYTVSLSGGAPRRLTFEHNGVYDLMWTPDGRSITFISDRGMLPRPWRVPARGGPVEPETVYPGVGSVSSDGARFAYADANGEAPAIWRADLTSPGGRVITRNKIISSQYRDDEAQPTPDGSRIALESERTGSNEIWLNSADGKNPVQLTSLGRFSGSPRWSHDGRWIAFDSHPKEYGEIYVIDAEGRNLHAVTSGAYENVAPSWSHDDKSIYFASRRTGEWQLWQHSLDTGMERQLTKNGGFAGFASPDGKTIYYSKFAEAGVWSIPVSGGDETLAVSEKPQVGYWGHLAVTDTGLYFLDADAEPRPIIEFYSFATHRIVPVLPLEKYPSAWQPSLSASADGRSIFYSQSEPQSGILMVENVH